MLFLKEITDYLKAQKLKTKEYFLFLDGAPFRGTETLMKLIESFGNKVIYELLTRIAKFKT